MSPLKLTLIALSSTVSFTQAAIYTLTNHSFEDSPSAPTTAGEIKQNTPIGWIGFGNDGLQYEDPIPTGIDGNVYAWIQGTDSTVSGFAQQLNLHVTSSDVFDLTFAARRQSGSANFFFDIRTEGSVSGGTSLLAGGAKESSELTSVFADYNLTGSTSADATNPYLVIYREVGLNGGLRIDNVRLETTAATALIPEPSSIVLLGIGGILFTLRRRR